MGMGVFVYMGVCIIVYVYIGVYGCESMMSLGVTMLQRWVWEWNEAEMECMKEWNGKVMKQRRN